MKRILIPSAALLLTLGAACGDERAEPNAAAPEPAAVAAPEGEPAALTATEEPAAEAKHEHGEDCGDKHAKAEPGVETGCQDVAGHELTNPEAKPVTRADGTPATHLGDDFTEAPLVKVSEILADPTAWQGKTVALEGDISAMCKHKRGWFAVAADDKSGSFIRVMTAPVFLVPAGSVGRSARAEGTIKVVEVAAKHAKHLAGEHKLGDPEEITANIHQVTLRASGAEFF